MIAGELGYVEICTIKLNPTWPYRKDMGHLADLAASMSGANGLLQAVGVDTSGNLVWGLRRLTAAKSLGWTKILARVVDLDSPLLAMKEENEGRLNLSPSEQTAIMRIIEANERDKAKSRMTGGGVETFPQGQQGKTRDKAAAAFGHSGKTFEKMKKVDDLGTPKLKEAWNEGTISTSDAAKIVDQPPKTQNAAVKAVEKGRAATVSEAVTPPAKTTILCDRCKRVGATPNCQTCKELRTPKKKQTDSGAGAAMSEGASAESGSVAVLPEEPEAKSAIAGGSIPSTGDAGERAEHGAPSATVADHTPPAPINWATLNAQLQAALDAVSRGDTNAATAAIENCFAFVADHGGPPKPKARKGRAPDPLFDAVAHFTGTDPKASGSHVGKVCAQLRKAEPPYTPEEVAALPAAMAAAHSWFDGLLTLGMVEKYIGLTRAKLPEKPRSDRNGTGTGRPVGPSCRIGVTAKQLEAIAAKTIRCGPTEAEPGKGGAPVG